VLRALSLCTCCRHYPGAAAGRRRRSSHPAVSTFPDNVVGSACTPSFSRPAQRSLALRPAHSRRHLYVTCYTEGFSHFVTSMTAPVASGWSDLAGWGLRPLESAALSRRTRTADSGRRASSCSHFRRQHRFTDRRNISSSRQLPSRLLAWRDRAVFLFAPRHDLQRLIRQGPLQLQRRDRFTLKPDRPPPAW
jgi:hypothetical protein